MRLYFSGHDCRYAAEQTLLMLFPGEKPEYPEGPPSGDRCELTVKRGGRYTVCSALLVRGGLSFHARAQVENSRLTGEFETVGYTNRIVKLAFYRAALASGLPKPEWGSLSGVRPAKLMDAYLREGLSPRAAKGRFMREYFVSGSRAQLCLDAALAAQEAARSLDERDVCLYVGIPFCPTRCAYCSFVSQSVERSFALVPPYVDALVEEIRSGGQMVRETGLRVRSFYMGGGTPTTLSAQQMDRVLTAFEESFDRDRCQEITVEAGRPDTITAEKLAVLKDHGVTRVSVNPQTMEDHVLRAIGRRHTAADIEAAMELVAGYGFPHVNMDLIAGLPADTPEGFRRSLDRCLAFGTDNVTVHTLALKKGSRILLEGLPIPGPEAVAEMLDYAAPALRKAGYSPYYLYRQKYMSGSFENTGWCRPGAECWYNVQIMSELCSILSFGAGGSTKMVEPGTNHIERVFNLKYPKEYTERPEKAAANQAAFAAFYESLKGAQ